MCVYIYIYVSLLPTGRDTSICSDHAQVSRCQSTEFHRPSSWICFYGLYHWYENTQNLCSLWSCIRVYMCIYIYIYIHTYIILTTPDVQAKILRNPGWSQRGSTTQRVVFVSAPQNFLVRCSDHVYVSMHTLMRILEHTSNAHPDAYPRCTHPMRTPDTCPHAPGLHNKIPAHKIFARVWVAQEPILSQVAKIFQGLGPKRRKSCDGDLVCSDDIYNRESGRIINFVGCPQRSSTQYIYIYIYICIYTHVYIYIYIYIHIHIYP